MFVLSVENNLHEDDTRDDTQLYATEDILDFSISSNREKIDDKNRDQTQSNPNGGVGIETKGPLKCIERVVH